MAIEQALVLAAGEGRRLRPLTYTRPKCMVPVAGKPILHHVLATLQAVGVKRAVVVVKYLEESVRAYFDAQELGLDIEFVTQGERYGTAAAFAEGQGRMDSTFYAVAGDVITTPAALRELAAGHEGKMTALLKRVDNPQGYGLAQVEGGHITSFVEKPAEVPATGLANTSLYVMEPSLFAVLAAVSPSPRGEYEMTDVLKTQRVKAVITEEYWLDMGLPWQLHDANRFLLEAMPERRGDIEGSTVKGKVVMEEGARIIDSYVEGPLFLGKGSVVGPHAYIRGPVSIGQGCSIGDSTTIKDSILFDRVNAKHLAYIGDSIVGEGCNFGAGTQIANYRFDAGPIKVQVGDGVVDTQRHKLGAVIGDHVKTGVLSSVMPGKMVGDHSWIGANVMVEENVERHMRVALKQDLSYTRIE